MSYIKDARRFSRQWARPRPPTTSFSGAKSASNGSTSIGRLWNAYSEECIIILVSLVLATFLWFSWGTDFWTPKAEGQEMDKETKERYEAYIKAVQAKELPPRQESDKARVDRWLKNYCAAIPDPCNVNNLWWTWP